MASENELAQRLTDLAPYLDVPDRDLTDDVLASLPGAHRRVNVLAWAAVAAVVVAALATISVAPARQAVADWLDWGNTRVEPVDNLEFPSTTDLGFGQLVDPDDATVTDINPDPLPDLGPPDEIRQRGEVLTYLWLSDPLLPAVDDAPFGVVYSVGPVSESGLTTKFVDTDSAYFPVTVGTVNGLWLADPHVREPDGDRPTTAGPTLLWIEGDTQFRLESSLPLDQVLDIVSSP